MRYLTAGESHGKALCAIIEGLPSGLVLDEAEINGELARRQAGYGRGGRMKIESDKAEFIAGVRGGKTLGSPVAFLIRNRDHEAWTDVMGAFEDVSERRKVTAVRPGHADFVGCKKYGFDDARNVLERSSARETAARVGVGAVCRALLKTVGVEIGSHVLRIGDVRAEDKSYTAKELIKVADGCDVRSMDGEAAKKMREAIDDAKSRGDTLGGEIEVVVDGFPACVGSYVQSDRRLDGLLAGAALGVQAIKAVEVGDYARGSLKGSETGDEIYPHGDGYERKTNHAGGIEGGMSNGEQIVLRAVMKTIPTLRSGLCTVDIRSGEATIADGERSDVCAVPAAAVVLENAVACVLADELLRVTGGDTMDDVREAVGRLRLRAKTIRLKK